MSFKESIIIPLEIFKECKFDNKPPLPSKEILQDDTLPSDIKMKLYISFIFSKKKRR